MFGYLKNSMILKEVILLCKAYTEKLKDVKTNIRDQRSRNQR